MNIPNLGNVTLYGTEKQYAWDAWQKAFDAGRMLPDHEKFEKWWTETALNIAWEDVSQMLLAAWGMGVADHNEQATAGFQSWWQEILDSQPTARLG